MFYISYKEIKLYNSKKSLLLGTGEELERTFRNPCKNNAVK